MKIEINGNDSEEDEIAEPSASVPEPKEAQSEEEKKILELEKKNQEYLDRLKRLQADFDNYKKRVAKEREEFSSLAAERIIKELLNLSDDFERAITNSKEPDAQQLRAALEMMQKQLRDTLRREGVVEIITNCMLDPFEHEAMSNIDQPGKEEGEIVECLQKGYKIGNKVIRPARVVVCHRAQEKESENHDHHAECDHEDDEYIDTDE